MKQRFGSWLAMVQSRLQTYASGPQMLVFVPALTLLSFWIGGETALIAVALVLPVCLALISGYDGRNTAQVADRLTGLSTREHFDRISAYYCKAASQNGTRTGCVIIEIDDHASMLERQGQVAIDQLVRKLGQRLRGALRDKDVICLIGEGRFAIALEPGNRLDLESGIQVTSRLQMIMEEPIALDQGTGYASVCIGFCVTGRHGPSTASKMLDAATLALKEAQRVGPSAIRAYSNQIKDERSQRIAFMGDAVDALDAGQIQAWYQPQICTDTGKIAGFEALARWVHPQRGVIPPGEFLDAMETAGKMERLTEIVIYQVCNALRAWDQAGLDISRVGVNFSGQELLNPKLPQKIQWELDRFELTPERLTVEVLDSVVATRNDTISRNINALAAMGCGIDLDDFGTGNTSIGSLRAFSVDRVKVDRSFVAKSDRDPEQQRLVMAILTMCEQLNLKTVAEGVETVGEHALLAQLGCDYVQGFGIARPMPFDQTIDWVRAHNQKLENTPRILPASRRA